MIEYLRINLKNFVAASSIVSQIEHECSLFLTDVEIDLSSVRMNVDYLLFLRRVTMCILLWIPDGAGMWLEVSPDVSSGLVVMASDSSIPILIRLLSFRIPPWAPCHLFSLFYFVLLLVPG